MRFARDTLYLFRSIGALLLLIGIWVFACAFANDQKPDDWGGE